MGNPFERWSAQASIEAREQAQSEWEKYTKSQMSAQHSTMQAQQAMAATAANWQQQAAVWQGILKPVTPPYTGIPRLPALLATLNKSSFHLAVTKVSLEINESTLYWPQIRTKVSESLDKQVQGLLSKVS